MPSWATCAKKAWSARRGRLPVWMGRLWLLPFSLVQSLLQWARGWLQRWRSSGSSVGAAAGASVWAACRRPGLGAGAPLFPQAASPTAPSSKITNPILVFINSLSILYQRDISSKPLFRCDFDAAQHRLPQRLKHRRGGVQRGHSPTTSTVLPSASRGPPSGPRSVGPPWWSRLRRWSTCRCRLLVGGDHFGVLDWASMVAWAEIGLPEGEVRMPWGS